MATSGVRCHLRNLISLRIVPLFSEKILKSRCANEFYVLNVCRADFWECLPCFYCRPRRVPIFTDAQAAITFAIASTGTISQKYKSIMPNFRASYKNTSTELAFQKCHQIFYINDGWSWLLGHFTRILLMLPVFPISNNPPLLTLRNVNSDIWGASRRTRHIAATHTHTPTRLAKHTRAGTGTSSRRFWGWPVFFWDAVSEVGGCVCVVGWMNGWLSGWVWVGGCGRWVRYEKLLVSSVKSLMRYEKHSHLWNHSSAKHSHVSNQSWGFCEGGKVDRMIVDW